MTNICIITKLNDGIFFRLIDSIKRHEKRIQDDLTICVCYTGEDPSEFQRIDQSLVSWRHHTIQRPYHFAENANELASLVSTSRNLVFLNDDVELTEDDTISTMIDKLDDETIGTVGIKLLYPNGTVQHFGQSLYVDSSFGFLGVGHHMYKKISSDVPDIDIETTGNTFACVAVKTKNFNKIGGLDLRFKRCFEDVTFNWMCLADGLHNVCVGTKHAIHHESLTRGDHDIDRNDVDLLMLSFSKLRERMNNSITVNTRGVYQMFPGI